MASLLVIPIDEEETAIGTNAERNPKEPLVVGKRKVRRVCANQSRTGRRQELGVDALAVHVEQEEAVSKFGWELIGEVNCRAAMRMSAPNRIGRPVPAVWCCTEVVQVVRDRFDVAKDKGVEVRPSLANVPGTLNHVIEVRDHAGRNHRLTAIVKVYSPGIAASPGEDLKLVSGGMIAPHSSIHRRAQLVGCSWLSNA